MSLTISFCLDFVGKEKVECLLKKSCTIARNYEAKVQASGQSVNMDPEALVILTTSFCTDLRCLQINGNASLI